MAACREHHESKSDEGKQQNNEGPKVVRFETFERWYKCHQTQHCCNNDHCVNARSLPIAAPQIEPHPELIEGEGHGESVRKCRNLSRAPRRTTEHAVAPDGRKHKDAIIQM